jgi:hypothetical protein
MEDSRAALAAIERPDFRIIHDNFTVQPAAESPLH